MFTGEHRRRRLFSWKNIVPWVDADVDTVFWWLGVGVDREDRSLGIGLGPLFLGVGLANRDLWDNPEAFYPDPGPQFTSDEQSQMEAIVAVARARQNGMLT